MENKELFSTRDFYLSAFLKTKDIKLVRTVRQGRITIFYFNNENGLEQLITSFYANGEEVNANRFVNSIRDLKSLVHNIK